MQQLFSDYKLSATFIHIISQVVSPVDSKDSAGLNTIQAAFLFYSFYTFEFEGLTSSLHHWAITFDAMHLQMCWLMNLFKLQYFHIPSQGCTRFWLYHLACFSYPPWQCIPICPSQVVLHQIPDVLMLFAAIHRMLDFQIFHLCCSWLTLRLTPQHRCFPG